MKTPLWKALALPCALCLLSASKTDEVGYRYRYGPFVAGESAPIRMEFLPSRRPEAMHFFVDVKDLDDANWHYVTTTMISSLPTTGNGYRVGTGLIPGNALKKNHRLRVAFGLSTQPYHVGLNYYYIQVQIVKNPVVSAEQGLILFSWATSYECDRTTYLFDPEIDPSKEIAYHDGYYAEGFTLGKDSQSRKLALDKLKLFYANPYGEPSGKFKAELRMISNKEEFAAAGTEHGGYASIPLQVSCQKAGNGIYRYDILGMKEKRYYSRIDYRMFVSPPQEPYFVSNDIYLPLREGHDTTKYQYALSLQEVGERGDEALLMDSAKSTHILFGPCHSAPYCVVIGG